MHREVIISVFFIELLPGFDRFPRFAGRSHDFYFSGFSVRLYGFSSPCASSTTCRATLVFQLEFLVNSCAIQALNIFCWGAN
jgi:hypothetical protein